MHNPARILIVDDNETNRDILVTRLSKHGYETLQAADGEEALASAAEHQPDLILLDVEMPKLDGFEVCRRLKKDPAMPFMPIILCTARAASQDVVTGLDAGADEYLTKPIDQAALVAALTDHTIAGAGLDVFEKEPLAPGALTALPNVVLTPHVGGHTVEAHSAMQDCVIANLEAFFTGKPLVYPVN